MASTLPPASDCCVPCAEPVVTQVQGPSGTAGAAGTNGTNGVNAFTTLTLQWTIPGNGASTVATVANGTWATVGQIVAVEDAGNVPGQAGYFRVDATGATSLTLYNDATTYTDNKVAGTVAVGQSISPAGVRGQAAAAAGLAPNSATFWTSTAEAGLVSEVNIAALGSAGLLKIGYNPGPPAIVTPAVAVAGTDYQVGHVNLTALAGLAGAANQIPYFTGAGAMALVGSTAFGRTLWAAVNAAAFRPLVSAAASGNNADITQLSGLTTPLVVTSGGTGVNGILCFRAHRAGVAQAGITTPAALVQFSTEEFDIEGCYNNATYRWVPDEEGYYALTAAVKITTVGTAGDIVTCHIRRNGSTLATGEAQSGKNAVDVQAICSTIIYANGTTDYFDVAAEVSAGGPLSLDGGATESYFCGHLVRAV